MHRGALAAGVAVACLLAGCGGLLGGTGTTVTPAPTPTPEPEPTSTPVPTVTASEELREPRYLGLSPTCERPPGLVVAVQMGALRNNDPATDAGVETAWRFAAPSNRAVFGSVAEFAEVLRAGYRPLLDAERVAYGPLQRDGEQASLTVTVTVDGEESSYRWTLGRQSGGRYDGCWMTTSVRRL